MYHIIYPFTRKYAEDYSFGNKTGRNITKGYLRVFQIHDIPTDKLNKVFSQPKQRRSSRKIVQESRSHISSKYIRKWVTKFSWILFRFCRLFLNMWFNEYKTTPSVDTKRSLFRRSTCIMYVGNIRYRCAWAL